MTRWLNLGIADDDGQGNFGNNNYLNLLRFYLEFDEDGAMATYAIWNNKGGVGKSYLTFQLACEYARTHPRERVLAVDLCPQANSSGMLLGGMEAGEKTLDELSSRTPRKNISGYIEDRITSPYVNPRRGSGYVVQVASINEHVPENLYLV